MPDGAGVDRYDGKKFVCRRLQDYLLADYGGRGLTEDKGCRKGKETGKGEAC